MAENFGTNPIIRDIYTADPAPMVYGDTLYLYTTHDENELIGDFYTMNDWRCYSTKDMVHWTDHGKVFDIKDIEIRFGMPRSTVANIMKLMEQKGYITRQSDEKDTRLKRVVPTARGFKTNEDTIRFINGLHEEMEIGITEEEKKVLHAVSEKMAANMQERSENRSEQ